MNSEHGSLISCFCVKASFLEAVPEPDPFSLPEPDPCLLSKWRIQQQDLVDRLIMKDDYPVPVTVIGGVDISFVKDSNLACACLVCLNWPQLEVIYEKFTMVRLTVPYVPHFLAFREVEHLKPLVEELAADLRPQIIFVDGNGVLHPRKMGLAAHLGVEMNCCTIGIGKNFLNVDGLTKERCAVPAGSEMRLLQGDSGEIWGAALRPKKPIFVSVGNKISLESAIEWTRKVSKYRIPEPVRQADLRSREFLRGNKAHC